MGNARADFTPNRIRRVPAGVRAREPALGTRFFSHSPFPIPHSPSPTTPLASTATFVKDV
jgi:hypothetical protein